MTGISIKSYPFPGPYAFRHRRRHRTGRQPCCDPVRQAPSANATVGGTADYR